MSDKPVILHGTAIAIGDHGVLILGRAGTGKSDLALRLIDRGALLISDDAVMLGADGETLKLIAAPNIEARLEIRGVGICTVPATASAPLRLIVDLEKYIERLPGDSNTSLLHGFHVPTVNVAPFEASAALKVEYALRSVVDAGRWPVAQGATAAAESHSA